METKSYDSISFEIESELSKPISFLSSEEVKNILSSLFKRKKVENPPFDIYLYDDFEEKLESLNETMKILNYNFDANTKEFYNYGKKSLIRGLMEAYGNHYPITVSPDMILILFLQGYSRFMENNSEKLRNIYVNFEGKKL
jgi:hypothetical protein